MPQDCEHCGVFDCNLHSLRTVPCFTADRLEKGSNGVGLAAGKTFNPNCDDKGACMVRAVWMSNMLSIFTVIGVKFM